MAGDTWRITRRRVPLLGLVYQAVVVRGDETIPVGPVADTLATLRRDLTDMLAACLDAETAGLVEWRG